MTLFATTRGAVPAPSDSPDAADVEDVVPGELISSDWGVSVAADLAELWEDKVDGTTFDGHVDGPLPAHAAVLITAEPNDAPMVGTDVQTQLRQAALELGEIRSEMTTVSGEVANEVWISNTAPSDPAVELWYDPDAIPEPGVPGPAGPVGPAGAVGVGVPAGGTTGQALVKMSGTDYSTAWTDAGPASATVDVIWTGTAAAYAALGTYDASTLYFLT